MSLFENYLVSVAPAYFKGPVMRKLIGSLGHVMDAHAQRVFDGRCAGNPYAGGSKTDDGVLRECEPEVLPEHAAQRGVTLYTTEPTPSRRYRTSRYLEARRLQGTHKGLLQNVQPYFLGLTDTLPMIRVVHQNNASTPIAYWHTIASVSAASVLATGKLGDYSIHVEDPSNFNYDDQPTRRSRFWVFIYMYGTGLTGPNTYDDGHTYDDGAVYDGGSLTTAAHADLVAMCRWKAAHSWLNGVALVWDNTSVDPTGTPTQDPDGWWSLPNGANTWSVAVDPTTGFNTRPPGVQFIYLNNAP